MAASRRSNGYTAADGDPPSAGGPEGKVVKIMVLDEEGDDIEDEMSDEERAALHRELDASIDEWRAGKLVDAEDVIAEIRARRT
jgi:hypothetical protein